MLLLKKKHYIFLVLLSIFGLALTFVTFVSFKNFEHEQISVNLKEKANDRISTFQDIINASTDEVLSLGAFFNASETVERHEFQEFSQSLLSHHPSLQALEWIPRVPDAERRLYEQSARQDGISDYRITERAEQGVMIPANKRNEYFPVFYIEPLSGNELAFGFDLGSSPARLDAMRLSRDTGKIVATPRVTLVQETGEQFAFLVFLPIYKNRQPVDTVLNRRKALMGFVLGVYLVQDMLEDSLSVLSPQGIDVYVYDENEKNPDKRLLGYHASRLSSAPLEFDGDVKKITQGYYYSSDVTVADRTWKVYCVPTPHFLMKFKSLQVWVIPGATFLFVAFVIFSLLFFLDRTEKIKQYARDMAQAKYVLESEILERKRSEAEKINLEIQLRHAHKLESIGTLAGGIAHDFNNILTIIVGNTELAKLDVPEDSPVHKKLRKIVSASKRAKDLVSQILSFSRKVEQDELPVRPHHIVKETITMLRSTIPATIEIQEDIDSDCGAILIDPTQIDQILINLCTNGVHAMHENGILGVSLRQTALKAEDLAHRPDLVPGEYAELSVSDTGTGIAPEITDRVFDPFFTTKEVGKGTGMGLSMVHGIVLSHRGMITVESELGQGSVFHVYFPVAENEGVEFEEIKEPLQTGTERILLVDDEEGIVEFGKSILEQQGFKVVGKVSSIDALDYVKGNPEGIDLVVTDQTMPEMSGTELISEIKKIRPDIPIVLCTGFSTKVSSEEEAKTLGITEFLLKPMDIQSLVKIVRKALDEKQ